MPLMEITAMSVVPPPMSTTMFPKGSLRIIHGASQKCRGRISCAAQFFLSPWGCFSTASFHRGLTRDMSNKFVCGDAPENDLIEGDLIEGEVGACLSNPF